MIRIRNETNALSCTSNFSPSVSPELQSSAGGSEADVCLGGKCCLSLLTLIVCFS